MNAWPLVALLGAGGAFLFYASASKASSCTGADPTGNATPPYTLEELTLAAAGTSASIFASTINDTELQHIIGRGNNGGFIFAVYARYSDCKYRAVWAGEANPQGFVVSTTFGHPVVDAVRQNVEMAIGLFVQAEELKKLRMK